MFALKIFKDNQNIAKVESNILLVTPQTQDANWTYIRRSEDVRDVFWTSNARSIYVLCLRGRSMHQRKWMVFNRSSHLPNIFHKKEFCNIKQTHWKISLAFFSGFRSAPLVEKILMNKPFSVNGCKHLWASASEPNFRMSTILFVLIYIRYEGRVKRFKGVPLITSSSEPSTATSDASISWHFFAFFRAP